MYPFIEYSSKIRYTYITKQRVIPFLLCIETIKENLPGKICRGNSRIARFIEPWEARENKDCGINRDMLLLSSVIKK